MSDKFYMGDDKQVSEQVHRALYRLHDLIYWKAIKELNGALKAVHAKSVDEMEHRAGCKAVAQQLENLRDALENFGTTAGNIRSALIHANGCDNSCEKR